MKGWKTWAGGIGLILTGVAMMLSDLSNGSIEHLTEGIATISSGLAVIGIGHKIEKAGL